MFATNDDKEKLHGIYNISPAKETDRPFINSRRITMIFSKHSDSKELHKVMQYFRTRHDIIKDCTFESTNNDFVLFYPDYKVTFEVVSEKDLKIVMNFLMERDLIPLAFTIGGYFVKEPGESGLPF